MSEVASLCLDAIKSDVCCKRVLGHLGPSVPGWCAAAGQVCASHTGSLLAFSPDPGSSCQSRHKSGFPPLAHQATLTASLQTCTNPSHGERPKQNQADLRLSTTVMHTRTPVCNAPAALRPREALRQRRWPAFLANSREDGPI